VFHEFGHFVFAKLFKVKVEEFGIFIPPRLWKKKIGDTLFSINLLPFGAFVKLYGEEERKEEKGSFSALSIPKRILIVLGGALSFWVIACIIMSFVLWQGAPVAISDKDEVAQAYLQIVQIAPDSPAEKGGLRPGDLILEIEGEKINKIEKLQKITKEYSGKEILLKIKRGKEVFEVSLLSREKPPPNQGPLGVSIIRTTLKKSPLSSAFLEAPVLVGKITFEIAKGYFLAFKNLILGEETGLEIAGPVGVSHFLWQAAQMGLPYFLNLLALISIYLAIFNLLPIPALDGGKIMFLILEAVRKKPVSKQTEAKITTFFFVLLISLLIIATIEDIKRIF
jgi:regulator of sigma E protease